MAHPFPVIPHKVNLFFLSGGARQRVELGKSVDRGGRRIFHKKTNDKDTEVVLDTHNGDA